MKTETIAYTVGGKRFLGYAAYPPDATGPRPCIIIAHAWRGLDNFAKGKAEFLAKLGYVGFATDLYGEGIHVETDDEASELMAPLFTDRKTLRERIVAGYKTALQLPGVVQNKVGAIGFCFGGLAVLELLRSGEALKGYVSFHGLLGDSIGDLRAKREPSAPQLKGSLLILHGYQDPLVSTEDIKNAQREFAEAGVDWQMHIYGDAVHAFTNPEAKDSDSGLLYHAPSERRAIRSMRNFFLEVFE